jgi:hypothetical protein
VSNRILVIGTALISIIALMLGWLLGVSPKLAEAAVDDRERTNVEAQNLVHEAELAALIKQFEGIDDIRDRLDDLRESLPPGADLPRFIRQLSALGANSGVAITDLTTGSAISYVPTVSDVPAAPVDGEGMVEGEALVEGEAPVEGEALVADPATTAGQPVVTSSLVTAENFILIPFTVQTAGGYEGTLGFLKGLQTGERLYLVTNLGVATVAVEGAPAARGVAGIPASLSYETTITGYLYVLVDPTYVPPVEGDSDGDGVADAEQITEDDNSDAESEESTGDDGSSSTSSSTSPSPSPTP